MFVLCNMSFLTDTGITTSAILVHIVRRDKLVLCKGRRVSC